MPPKHRISCFWLPRLEAGKQVPTLWATAFSGLLGANIVAVRRERMRAAVAEDCTADDSFASRQMPRRHCACSDQDVLAWLGLHSYCH